MLKINDYRWSALARYHDAVLEHGSILVAFSRMPIHSHWDVVNALNVRCIVRIMNEMHHFCFNARKSIEISDRMIGGVKETATKCKQPDAGKQIETDIGKSITLADKAFWWTICRIIHSQEVHVESETKITEATATRIYSSSRYAYFGFRSNFDKQGAKADKNEPTEWNVGMNFISIEELVSSYVHRIAPKVEEAIEKRLEIP